jgi:hypothetical protein
MSFKYLDDRERVRIKDVYAAVLGRRAEILASALRNSVLSIDRKLTMSDIINCNVNPTHRVYNGALFHIDLEHLFLTSRDQDFTCSLGGEIHAFEVFELGAPVHRKSALRFLLNPPHVRRTSNAIVSSRDDEHSERFVSRWRGRPYR